jgi:hypothetical protein
MEQNVLRWVAGWVVWPARREERAARRALLAREGLGSVFYSRGPQWGHEGQRAAEALEARGWRFPEAPEGSFGCADQRIPRP